MLQRIQFLTLLCLNKIVHGKSAEAMKDREDKPFNDNSSFLKSSSDSRITQNQNELLSENINVSNIFNNQENNPNNVQHVPTLEEQEWHALLMVDVSEQLNNMSVYNPNEGVHQVIIDALQEQHQVINENNDAIMNDLSEVIQIAENGVELLSDALEVANESSNQVSNHS